MKKITFEVFFSQVFGLTNGNDEKKLKCNKQFVIPFLCHKVRVYLYRNAFESIETSEKQRNRYRLWVLADSLRFR